MVFLFVKNPLQLLNILFIALLHSHYLLLFSLVCNLHIANTILNLWLILCFIFESTYLRFVVCFYFLHLFEGKLIVKSELTYLLSIDWVLFVSLFEYLWSGYYFLLFYLTHFYWIFVDLTHVSFQSFNLHYLLLNGCWQSFI